MAVVAPDLRVGRAHLEGAGRDTHEARWHLGGLTTGGPVTFDTEAVVADAPFEAVTLVDAVGARLGWILQRVEEGAALEHHTHDHPHQEAVLWGDEGIRNQAQHKGGSRVFYQALDKKCPFGAGLARFEASLALAWALKAIQTRGRAASESPKT